MVDGTQLYKKFLKLQNGLLWVILAKSYKMLPNQFLTSISILLEVLSQLATSQPLTEPSREHPCIRGRQTGHRNKPWGKQTEEDWTIESTVIS